MSTRLSLLLLLLQSTLLANFPVSVDVQPVLLIDEMVCPVTGLLRLYEQDAEVVALEPLRIDRVYNAEDNWCGGLGGTLYRWIAGERSSYAHAACFKGPYGQSVYFHTPFDNLKTGAYQFYTYAYERGLTNLGGREISGRTNLGNSTLGANENNRFALTLGSGLEMYFVSAKKNRDAVLSEQLLPNGRLSYYEYNDKDELTKATTKTSGGQKLAEAVYEYNKGAKTTVVHLSSGAFVKYIYEGKHNQLVEVERSDAPHISYKYLRKNHSLLSRKELPEGRWIQFNYLAEDIHETYFSPYIRSIYAPANTDGSSCETHWFNYTWGDKENEKCTHVYNAFSHKTLYRCNGERVTSIHRFEKDNKTPFTTEHLEWGSTDSKNPGCLLIHEIVDGHEKSLFKKSYTYDKFGNPIEECIEGKLKGARSSKKITKKTFYKNKHLLKSQDDGRKKILYFYLDKTDLIAKRLVEVSGLIVERRFFDYDHNHALTQEIVDDGSSTDVNDLTGVTERRIHRKIYLDSTKGLPDEEEEYFLDLTTSENKLLSLKKCAYNSRGRLIQEEVYDANGQFAFRKCWDYDNCGSLLLERNAAGHEIHRRYDANLNLIEETGPLFDHIKRYKYDKMNRLICREDHHEDTVLTTHYQYDKLGQKILEIDPYGHEMHFEYDCHGREVSTRLPTLTNPLKKTYDALGYLRTLTDPEGHTTQEFHTLYGKPYHKIYPDGTEEFWKYNSEGEVVRHTATNGLLTIIERDWKGRAVKTLTVAVDGTPITEQTATYNTFHLLSETDPMGTTTFYSYDGAGRLIRTEKAGIVTEMTYDALGRVSEKRVGDLLVERFLYNILDRMIEERKEDLSGQVLLCTKRDYDALGRVIFQQTGDEVTRFRYNSKGELIETLLPNGSMTKAHIDHTFIDETGQRVKKITQIDPLGQIFETQMDPLGRERLTLRKNSLGTPLQKTLTTYDWVGRIIKTSHEVLSEEGVKLHDFDILYEYDAMGRPLLVVEAAGSEEEKRSRHFYNTFGQKSHLLKPDGVKIAYTYDPLGRLESEISSDNTVDYHYEYDLLSRVTRVSDKTTDRCTKKEYDPHGRVLLESLATGFTVKNDYDTLGRVTKIQHPENLVEYTYDAVFLRKVSWNDREVHYHSYDLSGKLLSGNDHEYVYENGRLASWCSGGLSESCHYDAADNLIQRKLCEDVFNYTYNALYQLVEERQKEAFRYSYDSLYNRRSKNGQPCAINRLNQILSCKNTSYEWDRNGNLIARIEDGKKTLFSYDARDRLIEVCSQEGTTTYYWDDQDRRLQKNDTCFLFQGLNEVGSQDEFRVLGVGKGAEIGASIFIQLGEEIYKPVHDSSGSLIALLNEEGDEKERYSLSAFGEEGTSSHLGNPWRFSSKRHDPETGLILFGRRLYDPSIGRFITADPLGYSAGPNLYAYCRNSPLTHFDLYGLMTEQEPSFFEWLGDTLRDAGDWFNDRITNLVDNVKSGIEYICSNLRKAVRETGTGIETITDYLPSPLRDVGKATGCFLRNGCLCNLTLTWDESQTTVYYIAGKVCPHTVGVQINGVDTPVEVLWERMWDQYDKTNGHTVFGIHVAPHGVSNDMIQATADRAGLLTHASYVIQKTLERLCDYVGPHGEVATCTFSRANLNLINSGKRWKASGKTYGEHIVAFMLATD